MYQFILFDLDGTLLDTRKGVESAVRMTIEQLGLRSLPEEIIKKFVGPPMQDSFIRFYEMAPSDALNAANLFRDNYRKYTLLEAELYPGILDILDHLKSQGKKTAVATNKSHNNAYDILEHYGIVERCDYVLGADRQGKLTKADIIAKCMYNLQATEKDTVLVGDSEYDAIGAEIAEIDFIAVTYGFGFVRGQQYKSEKIKYVCNSTEELGELLMQ